MKNLKLIFILSSFVAIVAIGCKKGDTGAQGAPGPAGPAGPDSIVYSSWITLAPTLSIPQPGDSVWSQAISAPAINQAALDNAVISSYFNFGADPSTGSDVVPVSALSFAIIEDFTLGEIDLQAGVDFTGIGYRYVIVPGTIKANKFVSGPAAGMTVSEVKSMSYDAVLKLGKPVSASSVAPNN